MAEVEVWHDVAACAAIEADGPLAIEIAGRRLALFSVENAFYATDDICTHGHAFLSDGFLDGHIIECPLHGGCFDIRSGAATLEPATIGISTYPIRIVGDRIEVRI